MRETVGNVCFFSAYEWVRPRVMAALHCEEEPLPTIVGTPAVAHHHHHHHKQDHQHDSDSRSHNRCELEDTPGSAAESSPIVQRGLGIGREDVDTGPTSGLLLDHESDATAGRGQGRGGDAYESPRAAASATAASLPPLAPSGVTSHDSHRLPLSDGVASSPGGTERSADGSAAVQGGGAEGGSDLKKAAAEAVAAILSGGMAGIAVSTDGWGTCFDVCLWPVWGLRMLGWAFCWTLA